MNRGNMKSFNTNSSMTKLYIGIVHIFPWLKTLGTYLPPNLISTTLFIFILVSINYVKWKYQICAILKAMSYLIKLIVYTLSTVP